MRDGTCFYGRACVQASQAGLHRCTTQFAAVRVHRKVLPKDGFCHNRQKIYLELLLATCEAKIQFVHVMP